MHQKCRYPRAGGREDKDGNPVEQLLPDGEVHVAAGGPGVDGEAEGGCGQRAPADGFHADEEHADEDDNAQAFLDELEAQE